MESKLSRHTRALLPVHLAGRPCDMDGLMAIARIHNLKVIEDCAHAVEAEYQGRKLGTFGDFGCFSFYVTKNVVTGEGGMVLGQNEQDVARVRILALHGMSKDAWHRFSDKGYKHYYVTEAGFKYNMMDIQAALGIHQLARVETNWKRRRDIWHTYMQGLKDLPITLPAPPETHTRHAYHLFTILIDQNLCGISRDGFLDAMNVLRVGTGVHYLSLPEHAYYRERFGWTPEQWPQAARIGRQTVSLPLSPKLTADDVERVITAVHSCILGSR